MQGEVTTALTLEHYPDMTEKSVARILEEACSRWILQATRVIHRVGCLHPGDQIVAVLVAGAHRKEAFAACEFIMDYLKTNAVIWKKEDTDSGAIWLQPSSDDHEQVKNWSAQNSTESKT